MPAERLQKILARAGLASRRKAEEPIAAGLVTHEFTLAQAPEAIEYAMSHPAEVMKAVVRIDD